jgi:hypothetical protein
MIYLINLPLRQLSEAIALLYVLAV